MSAADDMTAAHVVTMTSRDDDYCEEYPFIDVVKALEGQWDEFLRLAARMGAVEECGRYWRDKGSAPGHEWDVEHLSNRMVPMDVSTSPVWRVANGG